MASTNGGLKTATIVLGGLVLVLTGALAASFASASSHISGPAAQRMVDRGDEAVKELLTIQLAAMDKKLDQLIARQGHTP